MAERFTDLKLGMTLVGNREVFAALKKHAQDPTGEENVVITMPPAG